MHGQGSGNVKAMAHQSGPCHLFPQEKEMLVTKLKDLVGKFRDLQTRAKGVTEQLKDKEEETDLTATKLKRAEELMTTAKERIQVGHRM